MAHTSGNSTWQNGSSGQTPITAGSLENIEALLDSLSSQVSSLTSTTGSLSTNLNGLSSTVSGLSSTVSNQFVSSRRTSDVTVTNSATLATSGLTGNLLTNSTYAITAFIPYSCTAASQIKVGWALGGSLSGWWAGFGPAGGQAPLGSGNGRQNYIDTAATALTASLGYAGDVTYASYPPTLMLRGVVVTTSAAAMGLYFAQNTPDATGVTIKSGAWLQFAKIA